MKSKKTKMIVKVCGIKSIENIELISQLDIDMVGLNFYPPSVRYINPEISPLVFDILGPNIQRVGVFVNESLENIEFIEKKYRLDYIQLHGDEDLDFCLSVKQSYKIIKVFRVDEAFDFREIDKFSFADYFLFDTATKNYGGSGLKFDWAKLNKYKGKIPFLLSGGIGPDDAKDLLKYNHVQFAGIDINSKFESEPGIKDKKKLLPFLSQLNGLSI